MVRVVGTGADESADADDTRVDVAEISSRSSSRRRPPLPSGYKVAIPPRKGLLTELSDRLKETFLHDVPLRPYEGQTPWTKALLSLQLLFPIFDWGRHYDLTKFRGDLIAGLTIASLCIPQDVAYAKLANMDPTNGLYTRFVPPLIYAVMGSSRELAIGPAAVLSLLLGTLLQNEVDPVTDKETYKRLAFTATFFAGVTQAALGVFRLGFAVDFLSHAAIIGLMAGAAISIAFQQMKGFLGIKQFTSKSDIVDVMKSIWRSVHHGWNWQTVLISVSCLAFLLAAKHIANKRKKLFWVAAIAPMITVVLSTFFVYITRADKHGVQIVRNIRKGINPPSANKIYFSGSYVLKGFRIGVVTGLIALAEAIAFGRTFAAMKDYQIDGNKEMLALGTMNIVGSLTSCFVATGSFSRSAVNYMAGCQTTVSNMIMSVVVMLTLLLITPLFKCTPSAVLAAIIISVLINIIDFNAIILIWKVDKMDFIAAMGAFIRVMFGSIEIGLLISVLLSVAKILFHVTRPRTPLLGHLPRTTVYSNVEQYPEATRVPGILIVRVDSAIYFVNSNYVKERILRRLRDEEETVKAQQLARIKFLIVDLSPVTDIDTSGIQALQDLYKALQKHDIQLILANPGPVVIEKLHWAEFTELIGQDRIFLTVGEAVTACAPMAREEVES